MTTGMTVTFLITIAVIIIFMAGLYLNIKEYSDNKLAKIVCIVDLLLIGILLGTKLLAEFTGTSKDEVLSYVGIVLAVTFFIVALAWLISVTIETFRN